MRAPSDDSSSKPGASGSIAAERFLDKADTTALLGAFCFLLSAIEYMLPKPMPFMRLGIANLPILLAVDLLPFPWFLTLALVKVIGMSVISGSLFSYVAIFSLAGTMTAALVMWAGRKLGGRWISQIGVSILGAMASNAVQIFIARWLVFGQAAWLIAPLFLAMGLITGTALGLFAEHFAARSLWFSQASGRPPLASWAPSERGLTAAAEPAGAAGGSERRRAAEARRKARAEKIAARRARRRTGFETAFSPLPTALAGAVLAIAYLFEGNLAIKLFLFALMAVSVVAAGKRFSFIAALIVSAGIVLANLLVPSGRVLFTIGPFAVTQFALKDGVLKALTFEGLMLISKATIMPGLRLPGRLGSIVAAAFLYYDRIIEYKGRVRAASLAADADALMLAVWEGEGQAMPGPGAAAAAGENSGGPALAEAEPGALAGRRRGDIPLLAAACVLALLSLLL